MKFLWVLLATTLVCIKAQEDGDIDNAIGEVGFVTELKKLMQHHFNLSLKYLYTSSSYRNQRVEKSGMAGHLKDLSDHHWGEGIDIIKKFVHRSGTKDNIVDAFDFHGKSEITLDLASTEDIRLTYLKTLESIHADSKTCDNELNQLHIMALKPGSYDADWAHYFEEKLEDEVEKTHDMIGRVTEFKQMTGSGLALHIFDSHF